MPRTRRRFAAAIERSIVLVRGEKVILDSELAALYCVETRVLVQAVRRNRARFPGDFLLQLNRREFDRLRSQSVISNGRGGRRYLPYAFTEHGVAMLSGVLNSTRAVRINIEIVRAFVRLRRILAEHRELARRLDQLEARCDKRFAGVFDAIRSLITQEQAANAARRAIGFAAPPPKPSAPSAAGRGAVRAAARSRPRALSGRRKLD